MTSSTSENPTTSSSGVDMLILSPYVNFDARVQPFPRTKTSCSVISILKPLLKIAYPMCLLSDSFGMGMTPDLVADAIRRIATKIDRSDTPSIHLVGRDLRRLAHNMRVAANGPVSLTVDGEISIYDIDVKYQFVAMEKRQDEDAAQFSLRFVLGSDLEERMATGRLGVGLSKLELDHYVYRSLDLARTGLPGSIKGDPELQRFGLLPNIVVKCFKDAMAKMGLSSLKGVVISDDAFHP